MRRGLGHRIHRQARARAAAALAAIGIGLGLGLGIGFGIGIGLGIGLGFRFGLATQSLALAALALSGLAACRGAKASSELERQLAEQVAKQLGAGARVSCPAGQPPLRCMATISGAHLPIALTIPSAGAAGEGGDLRWRLDGLVVSGRELERQVSDQLAALGLASVPSCGTALQPVAAGDRVRCQLPQLGVAWATVRADGSYSLELALGEAAAARSQPLDEAQLDELSRALDREQGTTEGASGDGDSDAQGASADGDAQGAAGANEAVVGGTASDSARSGTAGSQP